MKNLRQLSLTFGSSPFCFSCILFIPFIHPSVIYGASTMSQSLLGSGENTQSLPSRSALCISSPTLWIQKLLCPWQEQETSHVSYIWKRIRICDQGFMTEPQIPLGSMAGPGHWTLLYCLQCRPRTRLSTSFAEPRSPSLQRTLRRRCSLGQCGVPTSQPCFGCSMASLPLRSLKTQPGPRAFEIILLLTCTGSWPAWQVSRMAKGPPFSPVPTKSRVSEAGGRLILSTWVTWHRVGAWNAFAEWVKQGPQRAF